MTLRHHFKPIRFVKRNIDNPKYSKDAKLLELSYGAGVSGK